MIVGMIHGQPTSPILRSGSPPTKRDPLRSRPHLVLSGKSTTGYMVISSDRIVYLQFDAFHVIHPARILFKKKKKISPMII